MATKNSLFESKSFVSGISDDIDQNKKYSNFNLNKTSEFSKASDFQTDCKKYSNKHFDPSASLNCEEKGKLRPFQKGGFDSKLSNFGTNFNESETEKCWKKNDFSNAAKNNSTLFLHISAFENSNDSFNKSFQKSWSIQRQKQINPALTFVSKNLFEFQRQQNDTVPEPEVTQFKASQRLLKSKDPYLNTAKSPYEENEKNEVNEILEHVEHLLVDNDSNNVESNNNLAEAEEYPTFIESKYAYEYYEEMEVNEILERVQHFLGNNDSTFVGSNYEQQNYIGTGSGDAKNDEILQAQLVQIRIRPQYIEYLRPKHGWASMCKFKSKTPKQYIQRTRTLLSSPVPIPPPPQSSFDPLQQTSSQS